MTAPSHVPPESLVQFAALTRDVHLRLSQTLPKQDGVKGTCFFSALLLSMTMQRFLPYETTVRGGDGRGNGGFLDRSGAWHGHYWVEARGRDGTVWVLDITADQFDEEPVVVWHADRAATRYFPGSQELVDEHVAEFKPPQVA